MDYQNEIIKIVENYLKCNNLYNYLYELKFVNNKTDNIFKKKHVAGYDTKKRIIVYNIDKATDNGDPEFFMTYYIYHELIHVKQNMIRHEGFKLLEKKILDVEGYVLENLYNYYIANYDLVVSEYNATIEGFINTMNYTNKDVKKILFKAIKKYYINNDMSKLYFFFNRMNLNDIYNEIVKNCEYDDPKKILYGLPIKNETYIKVKKNDQNLFNSIKKEIL